MAKFERVSRVGRQAFEKGVESAHIAFEKRWQLKQDGAEALGGAKRRERLQELGGEIERPVEALDVRDRLVCLHREPKAGRRLRDPADLQLLGRKPSIRVIQLDRIE